MTENTKYSRWNPRPDRYEGFKFDKEEVSFLACGKHTFDSFVIKSPGILRIRKLQNAMIGRFTPLEAPEGTQCEQATQHHTKCKEEAKYQIQFFPTMRLVT